MIKKGALTGLLLFGMFFGAGNLIFPPSLGTLSGQHFWPAIAGFVLSGVGLAVLTLIIGTLNPKGYIHEISQSEDCALVCYCISRSLVSVNRAFLCYSADSDGGL